MVQFVLTFTCFCKKISSENKLDIFVKNKHFKGQKEQRKALAKCLEVSIPTS